MNESELINKHYNTVNTAMQSLKGWIATKNMNYFELDQLSENSYKTSIQVNDENIRIEASGDTIEDAITNLVEFIIAREKTGGKVNALPN